MGVLRLHNEKKVAMRTQELDIVPLERWLPDVRPHAILVSGHGGQSLSSQNLKLYFGNKRKSNGGHIKDVVMEDGNDAAVVVFANEGGA
jgi:hypothetical protein